MMNNTFVHRSFRQPHHQRTTRLRPIVNTAVNITTMSSSACRHSVSRHDTTNHDATADSTAYVLYRRRRRRPCCQFKESDNSPHRYATSTRNASDDSYICELDPETNTTSPSTGAANAPQPRKRQRVPTKSPYTGQRSEQCRHNRLNRAPPFKTSSKVLALTVILLGLTIGGFVPGAEASREAKRLFDDLLSDYNRLIRPVGNNSHKVIITVGLKLSQLIDINLKHQVMTTNIWLEQEWEDYKLKWNPADYGGVDMIHVPAENIWLPDIVLFNNADGNYEVILMNKATVYYTGKVVWKPPALYKSTCEIDVEYFPFDEQNCLMKFASWTYDGHEVDLQHQKQKPGEVVVQTGIDMSEFYKSVEWDILLVPAKYSQGKYDCCEEPFPDITFNITMRRKTLFYTVNLIIPCVGISFLTVLVFYLPSDSGEKVALCISILVSLTVFFLLLAEIIPPTSLAVPLLGKYLLFTMILVTLSISVTVGVLNVHFRSPSTHKMSPWVRRVFIHIMPRLLLMRRPVYELNPASRVKCLGQSCKLHPGNNTVFEHPFYQAQQNLNSRIPQSVRQPQHAPPSCNGVDTNFCDSMLRGNPNALQLGSIRASMRSSPLLEDVVLHDNLGNPIGIPMGHMGGPMDGPMGVPMGGAMGGHLGDSMTAPQNPLEQLDDYAPAHEVPGGIPVGVLEHPTFLPDLQQAVESIMFIAEHLKKDDEDESERQDWKYVAMVLDRLFLWIFTLACVVGTAGIILQAPSLYDDRESIDVLMSQIGRDAGPVGDPVAAAAAAAVATATKAIS